MRKDGNGMDEQNKGERIEIPLEMFMEMQVNTWKLMALREIAEAGEYALNEKTVCHILDVKYKGNNRFPIPDFAK